MLAGIVRYACTVPVFVFNLPESARSAPQSKFLRRKKKSKTIMRGFDQNRCVFDAVWHYYSGIKPWQLPEFLRKVVN